MMGVGDVLQSPHNWSLQYSDQHLRSVLRRPPEEPSSTAEPPPWDEPSACDLVSQVPQYAARIGSAISVVQAAQVQLKVVEQGLTNIQSEYPKALREGISELEAIVALEAEFDVLLYLLGRCIYGICPEFRLPLTEGLTGEQGLTSLLQWHAVTLDHLAENTDYLPACLEEIKACQKQTQLWLTQLATMAETCLKQEEDDLEVDLSFTSRVRPDQLQKELASWLGELGSRLDRTHHALQPFRAASLLQDPCRPSP